jgi:peptidyl-prolyl cis-trans isomerase SurA
MKIKNLIVIVFICSIVTTFSQIKEGETLNSIAAVVGKEVITNAEVQAEVMTFQQMEQNSGLTTQELYDKVLNNLINQNLMVTKALEDSISVTDQELDDAWDNALGNLVRRYGSEQRIEDVYGKSMNRLKFEYSDQIRKNLLVQKLQQKEFSNVKVGPSEIEAFFNEYKDSMETIPKRIEVYHIVKNVSSDSDKIEETLNLAKQVRDSILKGEITFEYAALTYSADAATKNDGGKLGWFNKGKLVPEFENAAFKLQTGELSLPVKSPFGYHIIQTIEKKDNSINTKHIVFSIKATEEDNLKTKDFLLDLKKRVENGESFEELAKIYSDDKETKGFGGLIGKLTMNSIPPNIKNSIESMGDGEVSEPMAYNADPTKTAYHIIYKKRVIGSHQPSIEEDYELIKQYATNKKQQEKMKEFFEQLREEIFWKKY